ADVVIRYAVVNAVKTCALLLEFGKLVADFPGCRQLRSHALKVGARFAELLSLFHVLERRVERAARHTDHLRADADTPRVECLDGDLRSEEHTSELQSRVDLVCRLLLEKKKENIN